MLNRIMIIGRLTSQPELRYTGNEKPYSRICVAVDRYSEGTDFINVVVWNKQAENVCEYLEKGSRILVEGSLSVNSYDDKDGNKRYSAEVIAQNVKFLDRKSSNQNVSEEPDEVADSEEDVVNIDDGFLD